MCVGAIDSILGREGKENVIASSTTEASVLTFFTVGISGVRPDVAESRLKGVADGTETSTSCQQYIVALTTCMLRSYTTSFSEQFVHAPQYSIHSSNVHSYSKARASVWHVK